MVTLWSRLFDVHLGEAEITYIVTILIDTKVTVADNSTLFCTV